MPKRQIAPDYGRGTTSGPTQQGNEATSSRQQGQDPYGYVPQSQVPSGYGQWSGGSSVYGQPVQAPSGYGQLVEAPSGYRQQVQAPSGYVQPVQEAYDPSQGKSSQAYQEGHSKDAYSKRRLAYGVIGEDKVFGPPPRSPYADETPAEHEAYLHEKARKAPEEAEERRRAEYIKKHGFK